MIDTRATTTLDDWYSSLPDDMKVSTGIMGLLTKGEYIQGQQRIIARLPSYNEEVTHLIYFKGWLTDSSRELYIRFTLYRHGQEHVRKLNEIRIK